MSYFQKSKQRDTVMVRPSNTDSQFNSFASRSNSIIESESKFDTMKFRSTLQNNVSPPVKSNEYERRFTEAQFFDMNSRPNDGYKNSQYDKSLTSESQLKPFNQRTQNDTTVPSFEIMKERSLKGYVTPRIKEDFSFQKGNSPKRLTILQTKIGTIGNVSGNQSSNDRNDFAYKSPFSQTRVNTQPVKSDRVELKNSGYLVTRDQDLRNLFPNTTSSSFKSSRNLTDIFPINSLIDIRNKIESANSKVQLPQNYLNELLKLASVITTQVKKLR